jgi:Spy/CpxP family protein refolding chaperone
MIINKIYLIGGHRMKNSFISLGVLTAFMLISALPGQAQRYWQQEMWPSAGMNLTSEQIMKIRELTLEFQKEILPMETELESLYMELDSLYYENAEQAKFKAVNNKIDTLEIELEEKHMAHENQIRALLTEEQKVLFDQWGGLGYGSEAMGLGMGFGRGYAGYGRGFGRGYSGYGRGYAGYGRGFGRGYSGYGRGYAGYGRGYGRGYAGYGRGYAGFDRDFGQGWSPGMGRGWGRGPGMGRGYWCPWFQRARFNWRRNWWR